MTMVQPISAAADRVMAALVAGLEIEFGRGAAEGLAARFLEAEDCDFCWDARIEERWLGAWPASEADDVELDRVAILGTMGGRWLVATCIVDGDEMPHGMTGKRCFSSRKRAVEAFARQR